MMELESVSVTDGGESVDDEKCDFCGYRSTEALADCCFRVGFIQLVHSTLKIIILRNLDFVNETGHRSPVWVCTHISVICCRR